MIPGFDEDILKANGILEVTSVVDSTTRMTSSVDECLLCLNVEVGCVILGVTSVVDSATGMTSSVDECLL